MIDRRSIPDALINRLENQADFWFDKKQKKFLHSIDTFYYSIMLNHDFTRHSDDDSVKYWREFWSDHCEEYVNFTGRSFIRVPGTFARFYDLHLQVPDYYDVFIASYVPEAAGALKESVTCQIIVQLRSYYLWMKGVHAAFEESYSEVKALLDYFGLVVRFVQENRTDYCWHTNYLSKPEVFLCPGPSGDLDKMVQSPLGRNEQYSAVYHKSTDNTSVISYLAYGHRGDKMFVRIYDKVREVLEMGYKPWFFQLWLAHGLINRYDLYCFEEALKSAAKASRYRKLDVSRLRWYVEELKFPVEDIDQELIDKILAGKHCDKHVIKELADKYTPQLSRIFNFEFQVMRKASKSFVLFPGAGGKYAEAERIYDYLDNHDLISKYLTKSVFCLKVPDTTIRLKDRDFCAFWKALRAAKLVDCKKHPKHLKFVRRYNSEKNIDILKKRLVNTISNISLYQNGINDFNLYHDAALAVSMLNDNDVEKQWHYKRNRSKQLNADELSPIPAVYNKSFSFLDNSTGEIIEPSSFGEYFDEEDPDDGG